MHPLRLTRLLRKLYMPSLILWIALVVAMSSLAPAQEISIPPSVSCVLMNVEDGSVLASQAADRPMTPASLVKLMTIHLVLCDLEGGSLLPMEPVRIRAEEAAAAFHPEASVMGLTQGMDIPLLTLLQGAAILSGNDAALAVARHVAGSVPCFVKRMNQEARSLGLTSTHFEDPVGLSPDNATTAMDMAVFARLYVREHPLAPALIHAPAVFPRVDSGKQMPNRNPLIGSFQGCLGLKTGFTSRSGYNLIAYAVRGETRLVAVVMGLQAESSAQGYAGVADLATRLLEQGFLRPGGS